MAIINAKRIDSISDLKATTEIHILECNNWPAFPYKPDVKFQIAHDDKHIFLRYTVREKEIRALYVVDQEPVYKDSCVEFFIEPVNDGFYYNFEFNCVGAALLGFGDSRYNRIRASADVMHQIIRTSSMEHKVQELQRGKFEWELEVVIPLTAFFKHQITSLSEQMTKANFYKCGDELTEPHYLSMHKIGTDKPDFQRPEYFGELYFEPANK